MHAHHSTEHWSSRLPFYYGWLIVGIAFVTMAIGVTARTAFSLLMGPLIDEFGWHRGLAAGAFSFGFLVSAVLSPIVGRVMDARGPRVVILTGLSLMTAGLFLAPRIERPWHLYVTLGLLVSAGANMMTYTAHSQFLPNWFVRRRALAVSIAFSGVGVGAIVLLPWLQSIIVTDGWRASCWAMALLAIFAAGPLNLFVRKRPQDIGLLPDVNQRRFQEAGSRPRISSMPPGPPKNGRSRAPSAPADSGGSWSAISAPSSPGMPCRCTRRSTLSRPASRRWWRPGRLES